MRSPATIERGSLMAAVLIALVVSCDAQPPDDIEPPSVSWTGQDARPVPSAGRLEYEDELDFQILNDRSNLCPEDIDQVECRARYTHARMRRDRERQVPGLPPPLTPEDVLDVQQRWFASGAGVTVQNPTAHRLHVSASFGSSSDAGCGFNVSAKPVEAVGSAMLPADDACEYDRATVSILDQFGLLLDARTILKSGGAR